MLSPILSNSKSFFVYWSRFRVITLAVLVTFSSSVISPAFAQDAANDEEGVSVAQESDQDLCNTPGVMVVGVMPDMDSNLADSSKGGEQDNNVIVDKKADVAPVVIAGSNATTSLSGYMDKACEAVGENNCQYFVAGAPVFVNEMGKKVIGRQIKAFIFKGELKSVFSAGETTTFIRRNIVDFLRSGMYKKAIKVAKKGDYKESGEQMKRGIIAIIMLWPIQLGAGYLSGPIFEKLGVKGEIAANVDVYSKGNAYFSGFHEFAGKTSEALVSLEHPTFKWVPTVANSGMLYLIHKWFGENISNMLKNAGHIAAEATADDPKAAIMVLVASEAIASVATTAGVIGIIYFDHSYDKYQLFNFTGIANDTKATIGTMYDYGKYGLNKMLDDPKGLLDEMYENSDKLSGAISENRIGKMASSGISEFYPATSLTLAGGLNIVLTAMVGGKSGLADKALFDTANLWIKSFIATNALGTKDILIRSSDETTEDQWGIINRGLLANGLISSPYVVMFIFPGLISNTPVGQVMVRGWAVKAAVESFERVAKADLAAFNQKDQGWTKTISDWTPFTLSVGEYGLVKSGIVEPTAGLRNIFTVISLLTSIFSFYALYNVGM